MNGEDVKKRADAAFLDQAAHIGVWTEAMSYCLPRKRWIMNGQNANRGPYVPDAKIQNSVAVLALQNMASCMCSAFMNPANIWAEWQAHEFLGKADDEVKEFYAHATRVGMLTFDASFYDRVYEGVLDAGAMGTTFIQIEGEISGSDAPLNCKTWDIGSYAIGENCAGEVDRAWRRIEKTPVQAAAEWPSYKPPRWGRMKEADKMTKIESYTLEIMPRDEYDVGMSEGPAGMEYRGTIIHDESNDVVWEGGWPEFPGVAYRFQKQSGSSPWGVGPGINALPDMRGVNFMDTVMADGVGKAVDPPMAFKDDMRGILDFRMGGANAISDMANMPKPILQVGNLQSAQAFLDSKIRQLEEHFFKSLFTPFLGDQRTLKAAQVYEMKNDVMKSFAPFGQRFLEFTSKILRRVFMILVRQGAFGQWSAGNVPRGAIRGKTFVYPKVVHQSMMALELKNLSRDRVRQFVQDITPVFTADPRTLNTINFTQLCRLLGADDVSMPGIMRTDEEIAAIEQAQAMAAQQQQALEMASKFATKNPDHAALALQSVA